MSKPHLKNFSTELENNPKELVKYLDLALEGANLGIWDWYLKDNSVKFDRRWAEMLGLDYDKIKMELATWESRVHPDDLAKAYADIKAYMEGKTDYYENIHRMKHVDGHWVYILDRGRFSDWDKDGKPARFTGTHFNITKSERYKNKISLFYEHSPFGYAFCDMKGNFLEINTRYSEILGYNLEELKKLSYWDITPRKYEADEAKLLESLELNGRYGPYRKEYIRKDGSTVPVELNGFLLEDYDGAKGIWSTVEDISEKKTLESQLVHSSKLASIGILAAGVGHEINNPLAIISLLVEKIKYEQPTAEELEQITTRIDSAIGRITKIVAGLRTFSKLDPKEIKIFGVENAIKDSISMVKEIFQVDGIEIQTNFKDCETVQINGNKGHLQQVFMNLLANARDATAGNATRKINIDMQTKANTIVIGFTDNGCGITNENLTKIFDPFFTTKAVNEGTGIGLSIVYSIVQDHQGKISVESVVGKGTTFHLELPVTQVSNTEIMKPIRNSNSHHSGNVLDFKLKLRVLLVEDESDILELISEQLQQLGLEVVQHRNGEDAFNEFVRNPKNFDLVISDIKMPKVDGITLLDLIRKKTDHYQPKFIFMTGGVNINLEHLNGSAKQDFDGLLYKPFSKDEIVKLLQSVFKAA